MYKYAAYPAIKLKIIPFINFSFSFSFADFGDLEIPNHSKSELGQTLPEGMGTLTHQLL